jgi:hypothetical protein
MASAPGQVEACAGAKSGARSVEESDRLHRRDVKPLSTTQVLAHHYVIFAEHVGAGLGEARPVALVGAWRETFLFGADQPVDLVFRGLVAVWAVEVGKLFVGPLVEKFALFHGSFRSSVVGPERNPCALDNLFKLLHKVGRRRDVGSGSRYTRAGRGYVEKEEDPAISGGDRGQGDGAGADRHASAHSSCA